MATGHYEDRSIVLITGANSGIGFATSSILLASTSPKYHVIVGARSQEKAERAVESLQSGESLAGSVSSVVVDQLSESSITSAASTIASEFGRLDILIHNAAIVDRSPELGARMRATFETNIIGPALVSEAFRPLLMKSADPYTVYVSSGLGSLTIATDPQSPVYRLAVPGGVAPYSASKAALNMLAAHEASTWGGIEASATFAGHEVAGRGRWEAEGGKLDADGYGMKVYVCDPGYVVSNLRGTSEEARTGGGHAGDPSESGRMILGILKGERKEGLVGVKPGGVVQKDGLWGW